MNVFVTGATGYIGSHLIPELLKRGHRVRALVRNPSKLVPGAEPVLGNALDASTFTEGIADGDTFIHLVGVPHPSPAKAEQFKTIDLVSIRESLKAIEGSAIRHILYLSVAQPAPAMKAYVAVRAEGERLIRATGLPATFIRPWYVLGPGHWWPYLLLPVYWIWGLFPSQRDTARRLYPVKLADVVRAIADAVDTPPQDFRIIEGTAFHRNASAFMSVPSTPRNPVTP
jgi:uncharacterized protein YbjT (DUF2867 family)